MATLESKEGGMVTAGRPGIAFLLGAGLLSLVLSLIGIYSIETMLPFNPLRLPLRTELQTSVWMPQGWAFFTRDPQEERLYMLRLGRDGWHDFSCGTHADLCNGLGLSRRSRALGIEMGLLFGYTQAKNWRPCRSQRPEACLTELPAAEVRNPNQQPLVCGDIAMVLRAPTPWAWWREHPKLLLPSRVTRLRVLCGNG